ELRRLVGLREPRSLARRVAATEAFDETDEPLRLVRERPRPGEERDRAECLRERVDSLLHVALEREARIVEPALEDGLVPRPHEVGIAAVRNEGETIPPQREVALVG